MRLVRQGVRTPKAEMTRAVGPAELRVSSNTWACIRPPIRLSISLAARASFKLHGLFTDGFQGRQQTKCDVDNDLVYGEVPAW